MTSNEISKKEGENSTEFSLENLPFEVGFFPHNVAPKLKSFPFSLLYDAETGLVHQHVTAQLRGVLRDYYVAGGYGSTPLGEGDFGTSQGDEVIRALERALHRSSKEISESRFLEIGASYGYLLHVLALKGAKEVLAVEPGAEGVIGSEKYGISMIRDFFPTDKLSGKYFDVVLSYCMMEHIEDPLFILNEMYKVTEVGGMIFVGVPECASKMEIGDMSIILHQHINYFTPASLSTLLQKAGLIHVRIMRSRNRGMLFAWGVKPDAKNDNLSEAQSHIKVESDELIKKFAKNYEANVSSIQALVSKSEHEGKSIGLYAPDSNLIGSIKFVHPPRIFNKDKVKHGKYINGSDLPFESPEQLIKNPTDIVIVAPIDYDKEIRVELHELGLPEATQVISLKEIYEQNSGEIYNLEMLKSKEEFIELT